MKYISLLILICLAITPQDAVSQHDISSAAGLVENDSLSAVVAIGSPWAAPTIGFVERLSLAPQEGTVMYQISALLHGAYGIDSTLMHQLLLSSLPKEEPYDFHPSSYTQTYVRDIPSAMVDWVYVQTRKVSDPVTVLDSAVGIVNKHGVISGIDGKPWLVFDKHASVDSVFVVVQHRNHLAVMTNEPVGHTEGALHVVDVTIPASVYSAYASPADTVNGRATLIPGDILSDGIINARDRVLVRSQTGQTGYQSADTNLDGLVNAIDRVTIIVRTFVATQVP